MIKAREEKLQQIIQWATANEEIRAVLLTSSLVNPNAPSDKFSDLDIEFVISRFDEFLKDDSWLTAFGRVIAKVVENEEAFDGKNAMRMVLYDDYVKVDFKLYRIAQFLEEVQSNELQEDWDVGYRVLIDKDNMCAAMQAPTFQSVLIKKPTKEKFSQVLNDCWWDMTYVAKCLARDEIFYARFMTENMIRTDYLVPIIEWYIAIGYNWTISTNKYGRLFKKYLAPEIWQQVEQTFAGSSIEDNWNALQATAGLVHRLGTALAEKLAYPYPAQLEADIRVYLQKLRSNAV